MVARNGFEPSCLPFNAKLIRNGFQPPEPRMIPFRRSKENISIERELAPVHGFEPRYPG
jgi:hypothetical protein